MDAEDPGILIGHLALADSAAASFSGRRRSEQARHRRSGLPIPNAWLPSPTVWTAEFTKLVRLSGANYGKCAVAGRARGTELAAIIADAQMDLSDHLIVTSTTVGPTDARRSTFDTYGIAHRCHRFYWHGDVSAVRSMDRNASWSARVGPQGFFMVTPDPRFPQGHACRATG
jgi:hypothetical protein